MPPETSLPDFHDKRVFLASPDAHAWLTKLAAHDDARVPFTGTLTDPDTVHHLVRVHRLRQGESLVWVCTETAAHAPTRAFRVSTLETTKHHVTVQLLYELPPQAPSIPPVTLWAAVIQEQRWKLLLEKACELGVTEIQPLLTHRTQHASQKDHKQSRWEAILHHAAEQSEGMFIPKLHPPISLNDALTAYGTQNTPLTSDYRMLCLERGASRCSIGEWLTQHTLTQNTWTQSRYTIAIGPEGGWHPDEVKRLTTAGFDAVSLTTRVLRCETAAIMALSALHYHYHR
jgi:16S rRNA (uracil1498-N3)-methyltransferase